MQSAALRRIAAVPAVYNGRINRIFPQRPNISKKKKGYKITIGCNGLDDLVFDSLKHLWYLVSAIHESLKGQRTLT